MNVILWLMLPLVGATLQARLPTIWAIGGLRLELLPGLVAFAAMTWRRPGLAICYAALAGLAQDALSAAPFGLSVAGYGGGALANFWLRRWLDRDLPWVQLLAGGVVAAANALLAALATGPTWGGLARLLCLTVIAAITAPLVFLGADALRHGLEAER